MESIAAIRSLRKLGAPAALLSAVCVAFAACSLPKPDDGVRVGTVLAAIGKGNMSDVVDKFAPSAQAQLQDRVRLGLISRDLQTLGRLEEVDLDPASTPASSGRRRYIATFEHGSRTVDVTMDGNHKFIAFWVHRASSL